MHAGIPAWLARAVAYARPRECICSYVRITLYTQLVMRSLSVCTMLELPYSPFFSALDLFIFFIRLVTLLSLACTQLRP